MTTPTIRKGDWIAVCDGSKALLIRNDGRGIVPNFQTQEVYAHETPANRDLATDRPGRLQETATAARSSIEPTDYHRQEEEDFLKKVAARLGEIAATSPARHIVIVAPPRALGVLRKAYSTALQAAVSAEIDQDLVHLPVPEIERRLAGLADT